MTTHKPDFSGVKTGSSSASTTPGSTPLTGLGTTGGHADFSGVRTGSSSVREGSTPANEQPRSYTVERGDTLSHIAQRFYGKSSRWRAIFEANRDTLRDPDHIEPGQVLVIPQDTDHDDSAR